MNVITLPETKLSLESSVYNQYFVYVAGPYTNGDVAQNVRAAIQAGNELAEAGFTPYIPHLTHFWHLLYPHDIQFWYELDLKWLLMCDYLLRLEGESKGADHEVESQR